ncbi:calcium/sodium antiporter [Woeseia oceani]|uniref:Sodium:proton exchanger n=1 Tax=Woeseia oceani TaxID=1548547 RepID=A0A193LFE8_9GAMM|nr:calcium/sodium antiporter [Woeseia oceani]ANO51232.1 sodium:proton exchanger [Woeseia oceani]
MLDIVTLIAGLLLLVKSADWLVQGASDLATRYGISSLVVGLTIVSFGTSMPELLVTLISGLRHNPDLAIGNVIGSNIANVLLVLGVAAIIRPLPVKDSTVVSEIPFSVTAALLVGFLANAALFTDNPALTISRYDGGILLLFFALFLLYVYKMSRSPNSFATEIRAELSMTRATVYILLGVVGLYIGGQWVVDGALGIAKLLEVDDALIGLTVVAVGTSAPELVASAVAARRGETDIAVGNVVGSNIFNLLWILGFTSAIVELPFEVVNNADLLLVTGASVMLIVALVTGRQRTIQRPHGILFVALYGLYLAYVIMRD